MIKLTSIIIGISLVANACSLFAMDLTSPDQRQEFMLQPIQDPQDLKGKLGATYQRAIATIEEHGIKLATMPQNSTYALVSDTYGELVGFVGCHHEEQNERRLILAKFYLRFCNDTINKRVARLLLCHIFEKHSRAQSIWMPLERTSNLAQFLQTCGFKTSPHQSIHHDPATFQGWECSPKTLSLSNI